MSDLINISNVDSAEVLAILYNNSKSMGMGFIHYDPTPMTVEDARALLGEETKYFDYLKGRVMKIGISVRHKEIDVLLYNRDNGVNAAQRYLEELLTRPSLTK